MNPTDAEIAGKLDEMECGDYGVKRLASTGVETLVSLEDLLATDNGANHFKHFIRQSSSPSAAKSWSGWTGL